MRKAVRYREKHLRCWRRSLEVAVGWTYSLVDAHLIVGVGDHSVTNDVDRLNIPTAPEVMPNKLLHLHIKGCEEEDSGLNLQTS